MSVGVSKHEHVLPYFLGLIENLRYPKDRIRVSFYLTKNPPEPEDQAEVLIKKWVQEVTKHYLSVSLELTSSDQNWKETALQWSRRKSCSHAFITTADHFLMENSLRKLIALDKVVVSPLLNAPFGNYSNVHGVLDDDYVYRVEMESIRIYFLYGPYLINLKHKDASYLTFDSDNLRNYNGRQDPIYIFAFSAYSMQIPIFVDNKFFYGYFLDSTYYSHNYHKKLLSYFLSNLVSEFGTISFPHSSYIEPSYPPPSRFGFDKIYLINLKRRPERLRRMELVFKLLGIDYTLFEAVDGKHLAPEELEEIEFMPGYQDPYYKRPMKKGEIGCFLSHYRIWEDVVKNSYSRVIVFEDDVRFMENSTIELNEMVEDLMKMRTEWDFIYLGRKKMSPHGDEFFEPGHRYLSTVGYSYWTLGYALSLNGASKLIHADPLSRLLAIDEFLPIMYDKHPNKEWASYFPSRNLLAYAVYPVVVVPERYTHQPGYVSDTEDSFVFEETFDRGENEKETISSTLHYKDEF
uniref:Glycosyltransferase 25 family member n=1 Tax=Acrobeloides nanus TaxID=290746 RepID=A0A914DW51_9BILA